MGFPFRAITAGFIYAVGAGAISVAGALAWLFANALMHPNGRSAVGLDVPIFLKRVSLPLALAVFTVTLIIRYKSR